MDRESAVVREGLIVMLKIVVYVVRTCNRFTYVVGRLVEDYIETSLMLQFNSYLSSLPHLLPPSPSSQCSSVIRGNRAGSIHHLSLLGNTYHRRRYTHTNTHAPRTLIHTYHTHTNTPHHTPHTH